MAIKNRSHNDRDGAPSEKRLAPPQLQARVGGGESPVAAASRSQLTSRRRAAKEFRFCGPRGAVSKRPTRITPDSMWRFQMHRGGEQLLATAGCSRDKNKNAT